MQVTTISPKCINFSFLDKTTYLQTTNYGKSFENRILSLQQKSAFVKKVQAAVYKVLSVREWDFCTSKVRAVSRNKFRKCPQLWQEYCLNFFCAKILISHANLLYAFIHDARKNTCFSMSIMFQFEVFHQFVVLLIRLFLPTITIWKGWVTACDNVVEY